jgi:hypothetical protein
MVVAPGKAIGLIEILDVSLNPGRMSGAVDAAQ